MNTLNLSQQIIDSEFDNFVHSPKDYIRSMGWDKNKYKDLEEKAKNICPDQQDYYNLRYIIDGIISSSCYEVTTIEIMESNSVSDFLTNLIAKKILEQY